MFKINVFKLWYKFKISAMFIYKVAGINLT